MDILNQLITENKMEVTELNKVRIEMALRQEIIKLEVFEKIGYPVDRLIEEAMGK